MIEPKISRSQPRYRQIKEELLGKISSGEWAEGEQLPSELKLLEDFAVSRMTVHRALRELTDEGYLTRVQGVGTFVAERAAHMDALELRAIADEIAARGNRHSCRIDLLEDIIADGTLARQFNLPPGSRLFHSRVVHLENEVPLQLEDRWVNPQVAPNYLKQDFTRITPTEYLTRQEASPFVEHVIEATLPDAAATRLLGIAPTEPCLRLIRRTLRGSQVVTVAHLLHPGSRFRLSSHFRVHASSVPMLAAL